MKAAATSAESNNINQINLNFSSSFMLAYNWSTILHLLYYATVVRKNNELAIVRVFQLTKY